MTDSKIISNPKNSLSIELDCCVIPLRHGYNLIQTVDAFYALVDDPYIMGRITCCNVLSDLYAMGVTHCDNLLLILGIPTQMNETERISTSKLIMQGFRDCGIEAGTLIRGGQTIKNPWMMIGGVATSICTEDEFKMPNKAEPGDVIILTKPLGTHVAVNAYSSMESKSEMFTVMLRDKIDPKLIEEAYEAAVNSMATLNLNGAKLMQKYSAKGATDITGFGILNHAKNLAEIQENNIEFVINRLPMMKNVGHINTLIKDKYNLLKGLSPETSGGLLIVISKDKAVSFISDYSSPEYGSNKAWVVGHVIEGNKTASLDPKFELVSDN